MKRTLIFVFVAALTASANAQLLNRPRALGLRRASKTVERLASTTNTFVQIIQGAKAKDPESLYFLSLAIAKGEEVNQSGVFAFKYLQESAEAGNSNALFLVHLLMERATTGGWIDNFTGYSGVNQTDFTCTNKISLSGFNMADSNSVSRLLSLYESDVQRGVLAATNEINRIKVQFARETSEKREALEAEELRKRNTALLGVQLGEKIENERPPMRRGLRRPVRRLGLFSRRTIDSQTVDKTLAKLMPFREAVQKAKDGDGAGLYAVSLHYAKGHEISKDDTKAAKYLKLAAEKENANAIFICALMMECAMSIPQPIVENGPSELRRDIDFGYDDQEPNCSQYTDGISAWEFDKSAFKGLVVTNIDDVAKVVAAHKKAFSLGVSYATNELARFEKRASAMTSAIEKRLAAIKTFVDNQEKNARLAEELLGEKPKEDERTIRERERAEQRQRLMAIQEELRKARENSAKREKEAEATRRAE